MKIGILLNIKMSIFMFIISFVIIDRTYKLVYKLIDKIECYKKSDSVDNNEYEDINANIDEVKEDRKEDRK